MKTHTVRSSISNPHQTHVHADKTMLYLLWGLMVLALVLAPWHDTWHWALLFGLPAAIVPTLLIWRAPGTLLTRMVVAVAMMIFSALHIQQSLGVTELHFGIFVLLACLLAYRDWRPIILASVVIAIHHLGFSYLQRWGWGGIMCFTTPSLAIVSTHAAYVVGEASVLVYLAEVLRKEMEQALELETMVAQLHGGNGSIDLSTARTPVYSPLGKALQNVMLSFHAVITSVRSGTDAIVMTSKDIAEGNHDLSQRTEQEASALQQTSHTLGEAATTVQQNAAYARHANELAVSAATVAQQGSHAVSQVVDTMGAIHTSSRKMSDIIGVIDSIAFQTNILALNAAVEAARAGDQGRGFAVVASEVRNLAQRSAAAAREVKTLIDNATANVGTGMVLVNDAGTTMQEVVNSIQQVANIIANITTASQQQTTGITQINETMIRMDQVTQQNAILVEESSAAATSLRQQADDLLQAIRVFKLADTTQ